MITRILSLVLVALLLAGCPKDELPDLDQISSYSGNDLGLTFKGDEVIFKLWSPLAQEVKLKIYNANNDALPLQELKLKQENGVWIYKGGFELRNKFYTYQLKFNNEWLQETTDPYCKAVGINGKKGYVALPSMANPSGWENQPRIEVPKHKAVIYELHVRDFSIDKQAGFNNKGKFLALTESGLKTESGKSIGIDYIQQLGVTHVHLLPTYDFGSVDENNAQSEYNWGYDPVNYQCVEGSYATNPIDPLNRILEFKEAILQMHRLGIGVILDVVFNHTQSIEDGPLHNTFPYYYYRYNDNQTPSNASGCGNETASERPMYRKYMLETLKYWVQEFKVDGFRFDLMGIHDIETMNFISEELLKINPYLVLYGEGWKAGNSTLNDDQLALKKNASQIPGFSFFSDDFRDGVKGSVFDRTGTGYITGNPEYKNDIKLGITASMSHPEHQNVTFHNSSAPWAQEPIQAINYVSCHDNHTLYDKLKISRADLDENARKQLQQLALSLVLVAPGIPFLHAGSEFLRSKQGEENSYKSGDDINAINWSLSEKHSDVIDQLQRLILLRKTHEIFTPTEAEQVSDKIKFLNHPVQGVLAYSQESYRINDTWREIIVVVNSREMSIDFPIMPETYRPVYGAPKIYPDRATIQPYSLAIFAR